MCITCGCADYPCPYRVTVYSLLPIASLAALEVFSFMDEILILNTCNPMSVHSSLVTPKDNYIHPIAPCPAGSASSRMPKEAFEVCPFNCAFKASVALECSVHLDK